MHHPPAVSVHQLPIAEALAEHAALSHYIPNRDEMRRLAWRVVSLPDATALDLALAECMVWLLDYTQQQDEVIRSLRAADLAQRALGE